MPTTKANTTPATISAFHGDDAAWLGGGGGGGGTYGGGTCDEDMS